MSTYVINPTAEQEKVVKAFLEALDISFERKGESLSPKVMKAIERSREDFKNGQTMSYEEFITRSRSSK